jgi:NCS1 family nucleobase:cation symporter-1
MAAVKQSTGWLGPILMVLFLLNIISHNALNLYGAVLSIITSIQTFASQWTPSIKVRVVLSSVVLAGCCVVALGASADFISQFIGLILALLLVLVPWASINLIDFYLIKRGSYDISSIFRATAAFTGASICTRSLPISSGSLCNCRSPISLYVGPYANLVDGADLSWLFGLVVTVPLYYCLATRGQTQKQRGGDLSPIGCEAVVKSASAAPLRFKGGRFASHRG